LGESQELGQLNMVLSPTGLSRKRNCAGEVQQQQYITDPSSRQRGRYKITNLQLSKGNFKKKEKLVAGPSWVLDTKTDWPTD
jgi:hypothetical protein